MIIFNTIILLAGVFSFFSGLGFYPDKNLSALIDTKNRPKSRS